MRKMNAMSGDLEGILPPSVVNVIRSEDAGLPNPDLVSHYALQQKRIMYLDGEVNENIMAIHRMILRWNLEDAGEPVERRKPIVLCIFSLGGDCDCMWSMVDAIETSETPVYTVNVGRACSAAALIFLAGHRRFMFPRSKVLIHEGSAQMAGDAIKVMDASDNYRQVVKQMKEYVLSRTAISPAQMNKRRGHDWLLDAAYCLEHGACDAVVTKWSEVFAKAAPAKTAEDGADDEPGADPSDYMLVSEEEVARAEGFYIDGDGNWLPLEEEDLPF